MIKAGFGVFWSFRAGSDPRKSKWGWIKEFVSIDNLSRKRNNKRAVVTFLKVPVFVMFTTNSKRQFMPRHHAFPLIAV